MDADTKIKSFCCTIPAKSGYFFKGLILPLKVQLRLLNIVQ